VANFYRFPPAVKKPQGRWSSGFIWQPGFGDEERREGIGVALDAEEAKLAQVGFEEAEAKA